MTIALLALFVGGVLLYAGITGKSVKALLVGDNTLDAANVSLLGSSSSPGEAVPTSRGGRGGGGQSSGSAPDSSTGSVASFPSSTGAINPAGFALGAGVPSGLGTELGR